MISKGDEIAKSRTVHAYIATLSSFLEYQAVLRLENWSGTSERGAGVWMGRHQSDRAGGFEVGRNVSTTLRQPAFEFKLGFLAFGLAG